MAHFAKIENNIVIQVIVADTQEWCETVLGGEWLQTSFNTYRGKHKEGGKPLRKNFASIGYTYDRERDAFIPPQTFPSWVFDEDSCNWEAPVKKPKFKKNVLCRWNEDIKNWEEFTAEEIDNQNSLNNI